MKHRVRRHEVVQPLNESYRFIPLTQGQNAIVDAADYEWLSRWNWCAQWSRDVDGFYAKRGLANGDTLMMHDYILGCESGEQADHVDHDTLNNRRYNLRKCTRSQNQSNRGLQSNNTSGYKGVRFDKERSKWAATIGHKNKTIHLGRFRTLKEAVSAFNEAAKTLHGEFAHLNTQVISPSQSTSKTVESRLLSSGQ